MSDLKFQGEIVGDIKLAYPDSKYTSAELLSLLDVAGWIFRRALRVTNQDTVNPIKISATRHVEMHINQSSAASKNTIHVLDRGLWDISWSLHINTTNAEGAKVVGIEMATTEVPEVPIGSLATLLFTNGQITNHARVLLVVPMVIRAFTPATGVGQTVDLVATVTAIRVF